MKMIGIIGGMSPESTTIYYQMINNEINHKLGANRSGNIILHSVDFEEIVELQKKGDWDQAGKTLSKSAQCLEAFGANGIILATNTMHKVADSIESAINIPFIHIVDATADEIKHKNLDKIGLLGTKFTMQDGFYVDRMKQHNIQIITPEISKQDEIHRIIFDELCLGIVTEEAKSYYQNTISDLAEKGAEGVILGCTEIGLLIKEQDSKLPVFDSTKIHIDSAVKFMLDY